MQTERQIQPVLPYAAVDPRRPWRRAKPRMDGLPWPVYFIWFALACQVGLLFLGNTPLRLPLRVAVYGSSLVMLFLWVPRYKAHPSLKMLRWLPVVLAVGLIHPMHNSFGAGLGQIMLYISICAPLSWVAGCRPNARSFERVVLALWIFNFASAGAGVLQVYFPGRFQGATSSIVSDRGTFKRHAYDVVLGNGDVVVRPQGLTDTPGGAATGGLYAIVLGVGILLTYQHWAMRGLSILGMLLGLFAIILSQVRVDLVMVLVCSVVIFAVLLRRQDFKRATGLGIVFAIVIFLGGGWAFAMGGKQTLARFSSLTESNPTDVYSANRGYFITQLLHEDIPKYPFGAGLGRWGMMNFYFGHEDAEGEKLWVEIMWTAWIYDGGIPFLLLYCAAFFMAIWFSWKLSVDRKDRLGLWSGVVFAYNAAALAGSFVFPLFIVQTGLEFWLINACLFSASLDPAGLEVQHKSEPHGFPATYPS
jgi:hypothetical protein